MAVRNKVMTWSIEAGEDLNDLTPGTGDLFKGIALDDGKPAANGGECGGILQYGGDSGDHVTLGIYGISKFVAAAAVTAGSRLTCTTSGYFTTATSGSFIVGRCLISVSSGSVGTGHFDFSVPRYAVSSLV